MHYMKLTAIIPFIIVLMILIAAMYPSPEMIMAIMLLSGLIVIIQVVSVLKGDPVEAKDPIELPK